MKNKKSIFMILLSFAVLCVGYFVIRYALFETHGMKDLPMALFVGCIAVIVISYFINSKILSLVTSISYIAGFVIGLIFHTTVVDDVVGTTDNLWIIWTVSLIAVVIIFGILELIKSRKTVS